MDHPTGTCMVAPDVFQYPLVVSGVGCTCDTAKGQCVLETFPEVPCATWADCWFATEPMLHPVPSKTKRTEPLEPCVDQELDVTCKGGVCTLVFWEC